METTVKTNIKENVTRVSSRDEFATAPSEFWKKAEDNRFAITPMILLVMGIIGGIAAANGIMDSWFKLAAVAFPSTILLAVILSVAPMRVIYIATAIAFVLDVIVIVSTL